MRRRRVFAVTFLFAVLVSLLSARRTQADPVCESVPPSNVETGLLHAEFVSLLQHSAGFRQQCTRIAASRVLRVTLRIGSIGDERARAQTVINRYEAGGIRAEVTFRFSEDYLELLAHELEHVLEQVDGVRLGSEVAAGRAWRLSSGAYETARALEAGVRARQEYNALLAAEAVQVDARKATARRHPFD